MTHHIWPMTHSNSDPWPIIYDPQVTVNSSRSVTVVERRTQAARQVLSLTSQQLKSLSLKRQNEITKSHEKTETDDKAPVKTLADPSGQPSAKRLTKFFVLKKITHFSTNWPTPQVVQMQKAFIFREHCPLTKTSAARPHYIGLLSTLTMCSPIFDRRSASDQKCIVVFSVSVV